MPNLEERRRLHKQLLSKLLPLLASFQFRFKLLKATLLIFRMLRGITDLFSRTEGFDQANSFSCPDQIFYVHKHPKNNFENYYIMQDSIKYVNTPRCS